jgi:hypothetical protein
VLESVNTVEYALLIILCVGFITLLILSIILVSIMLAIMKNLKRISDRAENVTASAANIMEMVGQKVAPLAVSAIVAAALRKFRNK